MYEEVNDLEVNQAGLFLHSSGILGASPDGIVSDNKIIEIKCPFSLRDRSVSSALGDSFYVKTVSPGEYELNLSDQSGFNYYHQVQGGMHLTETAECDFIVWCPADFVVFTVYRDTSWADNIPHFIEFYKKYVAAKFLST